MTREAPPRIIFAPLTGPREEALPSEMLPWLVAALALASPPSWTLPCDLLWEWYADEAGGGKASCCVEDGAGADDRRTVAPPPQEYAVVVFRGKPRPLPWEAAYATAWDRDGTTAAVTLDVADVPRLLAQAETTLDDDGAPYLLDPDPPLIHFYVATTTDDAAFAPDPGYPHTVFVTH